jgi:hypothetical protein
MIRLVYGNFIRVWREKEASLHESRMKRLLLLNASHEGTSHIIQKLADQAWLTAYSKNSSQRGGQLP